MPIYEYKCIDCGGHFEKIQKASDEPLKTCETCGGELAKQWSLSGFQFKGEGWYVTDYSGKKNGDKAAGENAGTPESTAAEKPASQGGTEKTPKPEKSDSKKED